MRLKSDLGFINDFSVNSAKNWSIRRRMSESWTLKRWLQNPVTSSGDFDAESDVSEDPSKY